jgi:acyl carrier protein
MVVNRSSAAIARLQKTAWWLSSTRASDFHPSTAMGRNNCSLDRSNRLNPFPQKCMTQAEVIQKLQTVFDDIFLEPVALTPALSAKDVTEWDSLTHISLVVAVEKAFSVRFQMGEIETTRNVGEFADLILKRLG